MIERTLANSHKKAPVQTVENGAFPSAPVAERLDLFATNLDHEGFLNLALENLAHLNLSASLFMVFSAWKLSRLDELDILTADDCSLMSATQFEVFKSFLAAHLLRARGNLEQGFKLLEQLQIKTKHWIILYRFASETTAFYSIEESLKCVEGIRDQVPPWAATALDFNIAVLALNKGHLSLFHSIEKKLHLSPDPQAEVFYHWARGGYFQHLEQNQSSVDHYLKALQRAQLLPARHTDLPILAFLVLQQSIWSGDVSASREAWAVIQTNSHRKNTLSKESHSLAKALYELNQGDLKESLLRIDSLFENKKWSRDHLRGGEVFLWILIAKNDARRGHRLTRLLMEVRQQWGFNSDNSLLEVFRIYFSYLVGEVSARELRKLLLEQIDRFQINGIEKGIKIAEFMIQLADSDLFPQAETFIQVNKIPFLQRMGLVLIARNQKVPSFYRQLRLQITDPVAKLMLDLQLSRLTEDLGLFLETIKRMSQLRVLGWGEFLPIETSPLTLEFGQEVLSKELLIDFEARRVIAITTMESLDSQVFLAELLMSLWSRPSGISKEESALGLGYNHYDPIQHDPIVYNLIFRLRSWFRKQGISVTISSGRQGWYLNHRELVAEFSISRSSPMRGSFHANAPSPIESGIVASSSSSIPMKSLSPRLEWIMQSLNKKGFLCRADLMNQFGIKKSTAANDFNELIRRDLICRKGQGRGIFYSLKDGHS